MRLCGRAHGAMGGGVVKKPLRERPLSTSLWLKSAGPRVGRSGCSLYRSSALGFPPKCRWWLSSALGLDEKTQNQAAGTMGEEAGRREAGSCELMASVWPLLQAHQLEGVVVK